MSPVDMGWRANVGEPILGPRRADGAAHGRDRSEEPAACQLRLMSDATCELHPVGDVSREPAVRAASSGREQGARAGGGPTGGGPTGWTARATSRQRAREGPGGAITTTTSAGSSAARGPWRNCSHSRPSAVARLASASLSAPPPAVAAPGPPPPTGRGPRAAGGGGGGAPARGGGVGGGADERPDGAPPAPRAGGGREPVGQLLE